MKGEKEVERTNINAYCKISYHCLLELWSSEQTA